MQRAYRRWQPLISAPRALQSSNSPPWRPLSRHFLVLPVNHRRNKIFDRENFFKQRKRWFYGELRHTGGRNARITALDHRAAAPGTRTRNPPVIPVSFTFFQKFPRGASLARGSGGAQVAQPVSPLSPVVASPAMKPEAPVKNRTKQMHQMPKKGNGINKLLFLFFPFFRSFFRFVVMMRCRSAWG